MSTHSPLNTYHIMCTTFSLRSMEPTPALLRIPAVNGKEALTIASRQGTNLVILFATREKAPA